MSKTYQLGNLEITWLGHASFLISEFHSDTQTNADRTQTDAEIRAIYIDPYKIQKGPKADLILVTHGHHDHKDEKAIEVLSKPETAVLVGGENIQEGEGKTLAGVKIKAVPAYNVNKFRSPGNPYHPRATGVGFIIEAAGQKIYHAGDTDKIPEMAELGEIDLALLPIGGTYTMDEEEAAEAVKMIKPKKVIPMHYGTLAETPGEPEKFKELVGDTSEVIIL